MRDGRKKVWKQVSHFFSNNERLTNRKWKKEEDKNDQRIEERISKEEISGWGEYQGEEKRW